MRSRMGLVHNLGFHKVNFQPNAFVTYTRPKIYDQDTNTWNRHRESETLDDSLLFTFLSLRFFDTRRERHTIYYYAYFSIWPHHMQSPPQTTGLASASSENRLASSKPKSQLTRSEFKSQLFFFFFSNSEILSPSLPGMTSFTSPISFSIWGFYCDICDCHIHPARALTPALNVCT